MEKIVKLQTINIKSLSRHQLETAYFRLLKVSKMKTELIRFLEASLKSRSYTYQQQNTGAVQPAPLPQKVGAAAS